MNLRRVVAFVLVAVLLAASLWIVGGNAWAASREEKSDREWTAVFGSLDDLRKRYPARETNETAKRLEALTRGLGLDLAPAMRAAGSVSRPLTPAEERRGQAILDYNSAQIAEPGATIDAPPEEVIRFLEEKRADLDAIESLLVAGPPPRWSFDLASPEPDRPMPNGLGQFRLQRFLIARALTEAHGGRHDLAARSLEASWNLNESLLTRPETMAALLGIAVARLQVGILRKVNVEEALWRTRLATLDARTRLLDALVLESRPKSARNPSSHPSTSGDGPPWHQRSRDFLARPMYRVMMVDYSNLMRGEFAQLKAAPLADHFLEPPAPDVRDAPHIFLSISMPNTRNSFVRADRLTVDAELTSKILEARSLRKGNRGRWPAAIPGIEASRFPGASWRYEASPDGGRMSIAFSRELASPYGQGAIKALPLSFSSN